MKSSTYVLEPPASRPSNSSASAFAGGAAGLETKDLLAGLEARRRQARRDQPRETDLSKLLDANNVKYRDRNGLVVDANKGLELAAELMAKAGSEFEKIEIARMFGLTKEWVEVLGEGVEKFREMKAAANIDPELARALEHMRRSRKVVDRSVRSSRVGAARSRPTCCRARGDPRDAPAIVDGDQVRRRAAAIVPRRSEQAFERLRRVVEIVRAARRRPRGRCASRSTSRPASPGRDAGDGDALTRRVERLSKITAIANRPSSPRSARLSRSKRSPTDHVA